ncbi:class I SAM-dependent methyltransferase [Hansschlegelia zhihuaiae]|uniref:Methyltransferase domain-containing protein n=1 Tax=Hansschlegelia zhihuaiae TaxID=405005 RepID=A0A4Q0MI73_9HYPH|nr:methyltransferase domain-containing protein [Hansschlegelia zhihuaiae]RXF73248.1 methyltransferase domain-containing protein [Hansschlegelia zhihuaiae]
MSAAVGGYAHMVGADLADWSPDEIEVLAEQLRRADTAQALLSNYLLFNEGVKPDHLRRLNDVFYTAAKIGHYIWPTQLRQMVLGKRVLDFGCGVTLYGAVFRALGATAYVGIDPRVDMRKKSYRSRLYKGSYQADVSLTDVCRVIPRCDYYPSSESAFLGLFDVAVLHSVTQHLLDIEAAFREVSSLLGPGGQIWFLHDNFYAWAGHHMAPHSVKALDPDNADHAIYSDWRHVTYKPDDDHPFVTNLNRIRIDQLRSITDKYFIIEEWNEIEDGADVRSRLTDSIVFGLPEYTRRDLLVRHVKCLAKVRPSTSG